MLLGLGTQDQPQCQAQGVLPQGWAGTSLQVWAGGGVFRSLIFSFPLAMPWKLLAEQG